MTDLRNNAEGGTASATLTAATSGGTSGDAFTTVPTVAGTCIFDGTDSAHGSKSYKFQTGGTAETIYAQWGSAALGTVTEVWFRLYIKLSALPSTSTAFLRGLSGTTTAFGLSLNTSGQIRLQNAAGSTVATITTAVPTGTWFRVEGHVILSATAGQGEVKLYNSMDSSTATDSIALTSASLALLASIDGIRFGILSSQASSPVWRFDDVGGSTVGYIGSAVFVNTPPSVSVSAPAAVPYLEPVDATMTATDTDGTISTRTWALTAVPSGSAAAPSPSSGTTTEYVPDKLGSYDLTGTAVDNDAGSTSDTATTTVLDAVNVFDGTDWVLATERSYVSSTWQ